MKIPKSMTNPMGTDQRRTQRRVSGLSFNWADRRAGTQRRGASDANNDAGGDGKQSNPKDLVGSKKAPLSTLPWRVLWRVGLAMLEGMVKYGRHNYRVAGVRASVYFDSTQRHMGAWWEGENIDPDSGFHHIDKAIAGLLVLRDAMLAENLTDDRPPSAREDFKALDADAARIVDQHADKKPRHWTIGDTP